MSMPTDPQEIRRTVSEMEELYSTGRLASSFYDGKMPWSMRGYTIDDFMTDLTYSADRFKRIAEGKEKDPVFRAAYEQARKEVEKLSESLGRKDLIAYMPGCASMPDESAMRISERAKEYIDLNETMLGNIKHLALDIDDALTRPSMKLINLDAKDKDEGIDHPVISFIKNSIRENTVPAYTATYPGSKSDLKGSFFETDSGPEDSITII